MMEAVSESRRFTKGGLLLRDGVTFAALCLVSATLFGLTFLLFRSFEDRRADQGKQWSARGSAALRNGNAGEAVVAFRTALSFEPNDRTDQFQLAQALASSGKTEEATNYFLNLWEAKPGDGYLNLQLARLARKRGDKPAAVNYYRAAIFGSWEGDGVQRRRDTRLELADYFASQKDEANARMEILIAAGNAPEREDLELAFGDKLQAIGDTVDALKYYRKAIQDDPLREVALERAGRTAYALGKYKDALALLNRALIKTKRGTDDDKTNALTQLVKDSQRLVDLDISRELPAVDRSQHLLAARTIAEKRLQACVTQVTGGQKNSASQPLPEDLAELRSRWGLLGKANRQALERDAALEDRTMTLIYDTEHDTATTCGQPEGDDALLLTLAKPPTVQ